jgi:GTP-binding protein HflX
VLPDGRTITLTDTVGFVRHLPHQLVDAFRSTLEEVSGADLLIHVVDGADPDPESQIAAVREVLDEIGAAALPELLVINKADAADPVTLSRLRRTLPHALVVSTRTGDGLGEVVAEIERRAPHPPVEIEALVPYARGDLVARVHEIGEVLASDHTADGTLLRARVPAGLASVLKPFAATSGAVAAATAPNGAGSASDLAQHRDDAT